MIKIPLPNGLVRHLGVEHMEPLPAFALRTPAGFWKYLDSEGMAKSAINVPGNESVIAEALYRHFTEAASVGVVIKLRDGSVLRSEGPDMWTVASATGSTSVRLPDFEAHYITDVAVALGTPVLLANATELERHLSETQGVVRQQGAHIDQLHKRGLEREGLIAEYRQQLDRSSGNLLKAANKMRADALLLAEGRQATKYAAEELKIARDPFRRFVRAATWGFAGALAWSLANAIWR